MQGPQIPIVAIVWDEEDEKSNLIETAIWWEAFVTFC